MMKTNLQSQNDTIKFTITNDVINKKTCLHNSCSMLWACFFMAFLRENHQTLYRDIFVCELYSLNKGALRNYAILFWPILTSPLRSNVIF